MRKIHVRLTYNALFFLEKSTLLYSYSSENLGDRATLLPLHNSKIEKIKSAFVSESIIMTKITKSV